MNKEYIQSLNTFLDNHSDDPALQRLHKVPDRPLDPAKDQEELAAIIDTYHQALPVIEKALWSASIDTGALANYQQTFRELEHFISLKGSDRRYSFIIVIPVADRPSHLTQCLNSLLTLCQLFHYGGLQDDHFKKVSVIVADDSNDTANIEQTRKACEHFSAQGLRTEYFGATEQKRLLQHTSRYRDGKLRRIVGNIPDSAGNPNFSHKGAAITRNITYLRLRQILDERQNDKLLFYFIDSDQQFNVVAPAHSTMQNLYAINYFHHLDEIFTTSAASILTGKVVGDPPVSPAVMAGHFQDDITGFLKTIDRLPPGQPCCFHDATTHHENDASYHDMASLFGFSNTDDSFRYHCTLHGAHNHKDCFNDFASKLNAFFHGEHPTRATYFNYAGALSTTTPARTIYTGNYIFRPDQLKHFIPFSSLQLRMAGPVLGRILKADINHAFVSANLPMLHNRTLEDSGQSEFRPGVRVHSKTVNLSGEFERQYFGDVMLFTIEKLVADGYPHKPFTADEIKQTIEATDKQLHEHYEDIRARILEKLSQLKATFGNANSWWNKTDGLDSAKTEFASFISNIEHNFGTGAESYSLIDSTENRSRRQQQIASAISNYPDDMAAWQEALA